MEKILQLLLGGGGIHTLGGGKRCLGYLGIYGEFSCLTMLKKKKIFCFLTGTNYPYPGIPTEGQESCYTPTNQLGKKNTPHKTERGLMTERYSKQSRDISTYTHILPLRTPLVFECTRDPAVLPKETNPYRYNFNNPEPGSTKHEDSGGLVCL